MARDKKMAKEKLLSFSWLTGVQYILSVAILFFIFLGLSFLSGCRSKEKAYISSFIFRDVAPWGTIYYKEMYIYNKNGFPVVPTCQINDTALKIADYHYHWYLFADWQRFVVDRKYKLLVKHSAGSARGEAFLPGNFEILRPESTYILNKDSVLWVVWRKANGATWYWLDLTIEYDYEDTTGEWDYYEFWKDTIIFDTVVRYEKNRFFPSYVDTIFEGEGIVNIWACDGPPILPGSPGNIFDAGYGFFHTVNQPGERNFYVGAPPKERRIISRSRAKLNKLRRYEVYR